MGRRYGNYSQPERGPRNTPMNEELTLNSGKVVHFYTSLTPNGIRVQILTDLTPKEKREFSSELKWKRDVVAIR